MSDLRIPPLRAIGIDRKEIETLRHEHHEISGQLAMSEAEVQNLEARRPQAQQADAATAAKVIRQGKKSPANATKNEEKLEEEIKRARRRCAALQQAQIDISGEISTFLSEHAGELLEEARATLEGAKATQLSAVSDLEAARSRRFQVLQAVDWISRYVPTEPLETAEAGDYFEVILPSSANNRPNDQEISRVLAWLRLESGSPETYEQLDVASDAVSVIDGTGSMPNSFVKHLEARRAALEADGAA